MPRLATLSVVSVDYVAPGHDPVPSSSVLPLRTKVQILDLKRCWSEFFILWSYAKKTALLWRRR